jgi:hypothetical protein
MPPLFPENLTPDELTGWRLRDAETAYREEQLQKKQLQKRKAELRAIDPKDWEAFPSLQEVQQGVNGWVNNFSDENLPPGTSRQAALQTRRAQAKLMLEQAQKKWKIEGQARQEVLDELKKRKDAIYKTCSTVIDCVGEGEISAQEGIDEIREWHQENCQPGDPTKEEIDVWYGYFLKRSFLVRESDKYFD